MSQGNWGGGPGGGWGGGPGGGGYGPPPGGAPPGGYGPPGGAPPGGYGPPPGGAPPGGFGGPPGGFAPPPAGYPPGYTPPGGGGAAVAWEDQSRSFFSRWWGTVKEVSFNPRSFFEAASNNDNPWPGVTFGITTGGMMGLLFGIFVALIYLALGGMMAAAASSTKGGGGPAAAMMGIFGVMGIGVAILYPIQFMISALVGPWISGGIYHLMLSILKGASKSYTHTVRVTAYAHAAYFWLIVPGFGGLIVMIVSLVSNIVGLDATHKCGMGKAVAAVLGPVVVFCTCCCLIYFLAFAGAAASAPPRRR
jgi:hypothetical protein